MTANLDENRWERIEGFYIQNTVTLKLLIIQIWPQLKIKDCENDDFGNPRSVCNCGMMSYLWTTVLYLELVHAFPLSTAKDCSGVRGQKISYYEIRQCNLAVKNNKYIVDRQFWSGYISTKKSLMVHTKVSNLVANSEERTLRWMRKFCERI